MSRSPHSWLLNPWPSRPFPASIPVWAGILVLSLAHHHLPRHCGRLHGNRDTTVTSKLRTASLYIHTQHTFWAIGIYQQFCTKPLVRLFISSFIYTYKSRLTKTIINSQVMTRKWALSFYLSNQQNNITGQFRAQTITYLWKIGTQASFLFIIFC